MADFKGKKKTKGHGAVFPEELVYNILDNFTKEGDIIYDPFMGTGTTAVVAMKMKRNFIGSEIDKNYIEFANKRINSESNTLF